MRHAEVHNPDRILYGRLPNFELSTRGQEMAQHTADFLREQSAQSGRRIGALYASPLTRTQQSAAPIAAFTGLTPNLDERLIEPANAFEGTRLRGPAGALRNPKNWAKLRNPLKPSWGEPFRSIAQRMVDAMEAAHVDTPEGDIVMVSHQLPIWMATRSLAGQWLAHDPRKRRCALASVTTFERRGDRWVEVEYADPSNGVAAIDLGAV